MATSPITPFSFANLHLKFMQKQMGTKCFVTLVLQYGAMQLWQSRRTEDPVLLGIIVHVDDKTNAIDFAVLKEGTSYCRFLVNPQLFDIERSQLAIRDSLDEVSPKEVCTSMHIMDVLCIL
ncbi:hypothetical protein R1flu_006312 [Riccia fluitans]|uniref:Uncharacterized protein n=1 Tax=Riccia fluitans TaxID=41844 RepID=A0ABD1YVN5_9MARC